MTINTRQSNILSEINWEFEIGLEYGPLANPILIKSDSKIDYVDFASQTYLKNKYELDPNVDINKILPIDIVLGDRSILEMVKPSSYDFILASHVLEHVPDFISWLQACDVILVAHGKIGLALPDRRFTFDHFRSPTTISQISAAWLRKQKVPGPEQILDFFLLNSPIEVASAWESYSSKISLPRIFPNVLKDASPIALDSLENGTYHDVHAWVFSDIDFCQLMLWLCQEDIISLGSISFFPTKYNDFEFFCTLQKMDRNSAIDSWLEVINSLAKISEIQFSEDFLLLEKQYKHLLESKTWRLSAKFRNVYSIFLRWRNRNSSV